jgi:hypothetical protein
MKLAFTLGNLRLLPVLAVLALSACSEAEDPPIHVTSALQDLTQDPDGLVTEFTFSEGVAGTLTAGNFAADGGQVALGVTASGAAATVTWDERVSPADTVRVIGGGRIDPSWVTVTSSDTSQPTFSITAATQVGGLGNDTITVQLAGPRVVETDAEDPTNWTLRVNGQAMDLTGSSFALDPATAVLDVTLGPDANLWASFDLAAATLTSVADVALDTAPVVGAATGDVAAPSLLSSTQNLTADPYGRVVDFTFDEAMDPVFSQGLTSFDAGFPVLALGVAQPTGDTLRVTFTDPVVPTVDTVDLSGLLDAHGNAHVAETAAIAQGGPVVNAYSTDPAVTAVANQGGDQVVVVTDQAFDRDQAEDPTLWTLEIDSTPVTMASQTLSYDFLARTLTIDLVDDWAHGTAFTLTPGGLLEIDGDSFTTVFAGSVTGDDSGPSVASIVQNRTIDSTGATLDVTFDEDLDDTVAENTGSWTVSGGLSVVSATRQGSLDLVRLVLDGTAVPGDVTVDVTGVEDLARNAMTASAGNALTSTDAIAPVLDDYFAGGVEGLDNDWLRVEFSDSMVESEVLDTTNWLVEHPVGTPLDTSGASVAYDSVAREATMTFDGGDGIDFQTLGDIRVEFQNARDIAGNAIAATPLTGLVATERVNPWVDTVWVQDFLGGSENLIHVRFSEPMSLLDDTYDASTNPGGLTVYALRDSGGTFIENPSSVALDADGMGCVLTFTIGVTAGSQTLDVRGATDRAGNQMFPAEEYVIVSEDVAEPAVGLSTTASAVSGEENDVLTVVFDRPVASWGVRDASNYGLQLSGQPVDLSDATLEFDGVDTVTIRMDAVDAASLEWNSAHDLTVDGLRSAQGVTMSAPSAAVVTPAGDSTPPALPVGAARLDAQNPATALLIELDEAVHPEDATDETAVVLQPSGLNPDTVIRLGYRTVRATWSGGVALTDTVDVSFRDLAGNLGAVSQAVASADATGPLLSTVAGVSVPGRGGDRIEVAFNEPVDTATTHTAGVYTVTQGGSQVDLTGATFRYESATHTVSVLLAEGVELDATQGVDVAVTGVRDHAGLLMTPGALPGTVSGDSTAPALDAAFVNLRVGATGNVVDLRFTEDVDTNHVLFTGNWSGSGGQGVSSADMIADDTVRLTLTSPLGVSETVDLLGGLTDVAGNRELGPLSIDPMN